MFITKSRVLKAILATQVICRTMSYSALQAARGDGMGGRGIVLTPTSGSYSSVVFWFHGLGDTADGWASAMPMFNLQNTKFVLPTANSIPITLNGGMKMPGWSDVYSLDKSSNEDRAGFESSSNRVKSLIQKEVEAGIPEEKIVLAGFSQGGALALHTSLRYPKKLAGCVALSTWVPLNSDYPGVHSETQKNLPILQIHGDEDMVVGHQWGQASHELLKTLITDPAPRFETIHGMGHSSDPDELDLVKQFLEERLS